MGWRKQQDSGDALVKAAKAYIEAHSLEKFSLKRLSETLYINGSYLLRQFKSHTGQTLLEYHNAVRCERAKALLEETPMRISEVGEAVGFVSSAHFSHVFKKNTGCTPTAYRERARGAGDG
jgi:two-component system response regulator YesN